MRTTKSYSDAELIAAIKTDQDINNAISFIYRTHYRMLEHLVMTNSGTKADAQDLIQEVMVLFVEMIQKEKYRGEASVKSFLYTLTRNLWITELRKMGSESKRHELFETNREKIEDDVTTYLTYKEAQKTVLELFDRLGETCKQILILFYYEDLSMKDILERTNYENEQVLRNRKYKCLKGLTSMIQQSPAIFETMKSALQTSTDYDTH